MLQHWGLPRCFWEEWSLFCPFIWHRKFFLLVVAEVHLLGRMTTGFHQVPLLTLLRYKFFILYCFTYMAHFNDFQTQN